MKQNLLTKVLLLFALIVGSWSVAWGADRVEIAKFTVSSHANWTINADGNSTNITYYLLTASDKYIESPSLTFSNYSNIKIQIKARKYGGPSGTQHKICVTQGTTELTSYTPLSKSLANSSELAISPSDGTLKISCPNASDNKGSGVSEIVITGEEVSDDRIAVNMVSFTAIKTTLVKGETTTTTVTNDQPSWTASYTYSSEDENVVKIYNNGTIEAIGKGTTKVWATLNIASNDETYKAGSTKSKSIDITVTNPFHIAQFSVLGNIIDASTQNVEEGEAISFPSNPLDLGDYNFMGWTTNAISSETNEPPTVLSSDNMGTSDVTYYAVFAKIASQTNPSLTKMGSNDTFNDKDKVVIVAIYTDEDTNTTTSYALYQKESTNNYIDKWVFDGEVATVADDDLNWVTANEETGGKWSLGDATNGYLYNSSNNDLKIDTQNKTSFTLAYTTDKGFSLKNGNRWLAYRSDLMESNRLFRMGGTGNTASGIGYFDIYKYVEGEKTYSNYCTSIVATGTISASGWNTFSSNFPIDLSTIEGGTAYVASDVTDGKVVLTAATGKVPAGTGLMIKGTPDDDFTIAVTADETTAPTNLLEGLPSGGKVEVAEEGFNYVFGWTDPENPGFYKIVLDEPTLGAGKAYLHTSTALNVAQAPFLGLDVDGETTSIVNINRETINDNQYYTLDGRRVAQPTKGLYIVNGRKVIVK